MILHYPAPKGSMSQPFGIDRTNDQAFEGFYTLFDNKHPGVDFALPEGSNVVAAFPGIVVRKEFHKGMGNTIGTRYGNIVVLYAHLSRDVLELGQIIDVGEMIGLSGNSGLATHQNEPHLHFEMRDITKPTLKEMVFDPPFNKELIPLEKFEYVVYNTNTVKTFSILSLRYFGSTTYARRIQKHNPNINVLFDQTIPDDTTVTIPNYR